MKKDNVNYLMVGIFMFAILLLLFAMLYRITGQQTGAENYYVIFDKITGVKDGAAVTYGGYQIGQIEDVEPIITQEKTRYKLKLSIKGDWRIPEDSVAQIIMPGIIADKQIEISEGISTTILKPGDVISSKEAVDMMKLVNSVGTELDKFIPNLANDITRLMQNLNQTSDQVALIFNETNRQQVDTMFRNANEASEKLVKLANGFDRVNAQLGEIMNNTQQMLDENDQDVRQTVVELKKSIDVVSENIHSVMHNLDSSSRNMNEFTRQLRDNPGVLLGSKPPIDEAEMQK